MIADVLGNYLDNIEEREFDEPFIAVLRANGFRDIHFLHGRFELGKDFIAKGEEDGVVCQYAFQTKAGDITLGKWREVRGQIDHLRTDSLAHPSFDRTLPRRAVFVTTGRLIGGSPLAAQEYARHLQELGEIGFVSWDRERLVEIMSESPEAGLAGVPEGQLLAMLGRIDANEVQELEIEKFSRRWLSEANSPPNLWRAAVEATVVANRLRRHDRLDLACCVSMCLVRAAWAGGHGTEPPDAVSITIADLGRAMFRHYASDLLTRCTEESLEPLAFVNAHEIFSAFVTYPVRCLRLIEILGLLGLLVLENDESMAREIAAYLDRFFEKHPGAVHPISDRWAVSLIPPVLLLTKTGNGKGIASILKGVVRWIGDRYEKDSFGLAGTHATPEDEVNYLLGTPFEHVELRRRSESYVSTVVLDLAAMLQLGDVYGVARNDFLAVDAMSCVVETRDTPGQYVLGASDARYEPNMRYKDEWMPTDGWKVAPHHQRGEEPYYLARIGRHWDHLAISSVLRDRHFWATCRDLLLSSQTGA